jgi:hypothetical protein
MYCGSIDYATDYLDSLHGVMRNLHALARQIIEREYTGKPLRVALWGASTPGWLCNAVFAEHPELQVTCFIDSAPLKYAEFDPNLNMMKPSALPVVSPDDPALAEVDVVIVTASPGAHDAIERAHRERRPDIPLYAINWDPKKTSLMNRGKPFILATAQRCGTLWMEQMCRFLSVENGYNQIAHKRHDGTLDHTRPGRLGPGQYMIGHYRLVPRLRKLIADGDLNAVFLLRDPRDIQVSLSFYNQRFDPDPRFTFDPEMLAGIVRHIDEWRRFAPAKILRFEDLKADTESTYLDFCDHVGWDAVTPEAIAEVVRACSFDRLAGGRREGQEDPSAHYRKGVVGDWRNQYSEKEAAQARQICAPVLSALGYAE